MMRLIIHYAGGIRMKNGYRILLGLVIVCIAGVMLYFAVKDEKEMKKVSYTYEFGDLVNEEKIVKEEFEDDYKILSGDERLLKHFDKEKETLPVGKYDLIVDSRQKQVSYTIRVEDTTPPEFVKKSDVVEVSNDVDKINWIEHFAGEDASKVSLKVKDDRVKYGEAGEYPIEAVLKDEYGNKTVHKATVKVSEPKKEEVKEEKPKEEIKEEKPKEEAVLPPVSSGPTYVEGILVVNKTHPIPAYFASGENYEAGVQIRKLIQDMQNQGYNISSTYSGFRNHDVQAGLYNGYVAREGQAAADTYSARPGYSEHETGLSFDLIDGYGNLVESQPEAEWIRTNAHKYGFIVRYPFGKEDITGFMPEPWHLRYIGPRAAEIYNSGLCLEEFLHVEGGRFYR